MFVCLQSWPGDALQAVAARFLDEVEMMDDVRDSCIEMCQQFHTTTMDLSHRYHVELERYNYVTPTSYLELINTFKMLLDKKRRSTWLYHCHICNINILNINMVANQWTSRWNIKISEQNSGISEAFPINPITVKNGWILKLPNNTRTLFCIASFYA